jgi:hypothetical protein
MPDEKIIKSNLEPINDNDLDAANKFGHVKKDGLELGENKKESVSLAVEKESPKEIVGAEKDSSYDEILSKISTSSNGSDDDDIKNDSAEVSLKIDAESQIQHLLDLATTKGVVHAVKVAKHMDDNYILDMLHDKMISEEFHKTLVEKNFVTE